VEFPAELQLLGLGVHLGDVTLDMADRDHGMPGPRQAKAHRPAKPTLPAGDQRDPIFAIVGHRFPPSLERRRKHFTAEDAKDARRRP
jgi:hypothetical protein